MAGPLAGAERRVYRVGELLGGLRNLIEDRVGRVWVAGEVSNLFRASSGHVYFSLRDPDGQLRAALFRNAARRVPFELEDGQELLAYGDVSVYPARGELQLVVRALEPRGQGALQLALEQLRARLEAEGLFDGSRKRPWPAHPRRLGVVTSAAGAALRDVLKVAARRHPGVRWLVSPTRVQGEGASEEIAAALARLGPQPLDGVLLVRGGGSFEDLWAFQSEAVVRAVVGSPHPVATGVGHETDLTLADLAADLRAPTPSAAAELALPDRSALARQVEAAFSRLARALRGEVRRRRDGLAREGEALRMLAPSMRLAQARTRLRGAARALATWSRHGADLRRRRLDQAAARLVAARPDPSLRRLRLRAAGRALGRAQRAGQAERRARLSRLGARLDGVSPLAVLGRGYSLVTRLADGAIVRDASDAPPGQALRIRAARALLEARVESASPAPPPPSGPDAS